MRKNLGFKRTTVGHREYELTLSKQPFRSRGEIGGPSGTPYRSSPTLVPWRRQSRRGEADAPARQQPPFIGPQSSLGRLALPLFSCQPHLARCAGRARLLVAERWLPEDLGSEKAAFWFGGGAGVKGFAAAGIAGSAAGKGGASYGWWAAFLHNFVVPNASWIAKFIALGEIAIGVALILGLFTGLAALAGLMLNLVYMFTGSAGVNPAYAILEVPLILAWRNAGYLGLDRFALDRAWWQRHFPKLTNGASQPSGTVATPALTH